MGVPVSSRPDGRCRMSGAHPSDNRPAEHRWPVNGGSAPADDPGRAEREGPAGGRFVVHVPLVAPDLTVALRLARVLAHRSATLPGVDPGGTTVSGAHHGGPCRP